MRFGSVEQAKMLLILKNIGEIQGMLPEGSVKDIHVMNNLNVFNKLEQIFRSEMRR